MCGITGILLLDGARVEMERLRRMTDVIKHRGPDGEGGWRNRNGNLGLGHRRLAILDLSESGAQPMRYSDRYTITYNGEIYNYVEIRKSLQAKGYRFVSDCDTEVLVAAYQEYGEGLLEQLDGMFAFAIWDEQEELLFCARDRFGEKPFFYSYVPGRHFIFASEMKCLFAYGISSQINYRMLFNYLAYDVVENSYAKHETFYEGIFKLEAAHCLTINAKGHMKKRRYWSIPPIEVNHNLKFEDACDQFRELFFQSVSRRLRSDVPVGSSLSGGLDSSAVVCTINQLRRGTGQVQKTFSARFHDDTLDEGEYIGLVADATDVSPHFTWPDVNVMRENLDKIFYHQEEPFGSASIVAQWEVMKLAQQEQVTVLLDGQGADESLGGYLHYFRTWFLELYADDRARFEEERHAYQEIHGQSFVADARFRWEAKCPAALRLLGAVRRRISRPDYLNHLNPDFVASYKTAPPPFQTFGDLNKTLTYSTQSYGLEKLLRFSDRNSMAFSREVRLPFLSHELVEFLFTLPASYKISKGWTKRILRYSMAPLLPQRITWRVDKLGFAPPQEQWLQDPQLRDLIMDSHAVLVTQGLVNNHAKIDDWQCLMTAKLFEWTKSL